MNILKAGIGLSKTVKNISRFREIVSVFGRNGFDEFISSNVTRVIPNFVLPKSTVKLREEFKGKDRKDIHSIIGMRLRLCFEELGPAFIKIGQLLSSREDLFDPSFIEEMKKLRDKVKGIEFSEAERMIESSLGAPISKNFKSINPVAVGTASIGIVYRAELCSGEDVVIKVRRPNIRKIIETDMSIFIFLISQIEKMSDDFKYLGLSRVVADFSISMEHELNFNTEALNCQRLKKNLEKYDHEEIFYIPKIYKDYLTEDILVMEYLDGIAFSDDKILDQKEVLYSRLEKGISLFIKSFLQDGFFHADLHGGNFFLLKDNKIGLIDFGLMGSLSRKGRVNFVAIIYSILTFNFENLVYEFLDVAEYEEIPNIDHLVRDIRDGLSPFIGLSVQQTNMSLVFSSISSTLAHHRIYIPREWFLVFRALITLDGVGKSLEMDYDLFSILEKDIGPLIKSSVSKEDMVEELSWLGKDYLSLLKLLPRHAKWSLREWSKNKYAIKIQHDQYKSNIDGVSLALLFLGSSILSAAFILTGMGFFFLDSAVTYQMIPVLSIGSWVMALVVFLGPIFLGIRLWLKSKFKIPFL